MSTSKKSIFNTVLNIAKAHIKSIFEGITENATSVAKEEYNVDLNIIKPSVSKVLDDLKIWNDQRKADKKLSREEMKQLAKDIIKETKKVLLDPNSVRNEELDEINRIMDELEEEFDFDFDDDFGVENEGTSLVCVDVVAPEPEAIALFTLGILLSITSDNIFSNYLISRIEIMKEILGITTDASVTDIANHSIISEIEDIAESKEMIDDMHGIVDDVEDTNSEVNLEISTNSSEVLGVVGAESASRIDLNTPITAVDEILRCYQRNEAFMATVDRVMILLNKIISAYNSEEGTKTSDGFSILSGNPMIHQIVRLFDYNYLDAVSLFSLFTLFGEQMREEDIATIETIIEELSNKLDAFQRTDEM